MLVLDGQKPVNAVTFSPDGTRLLATRWETPLDVWALPDGKPLPSPAPKVSGDLTVHPSGRVVFVTKGGLTAISLEDRSQVTIPRTGLIQSVIVSRDGRWVIAGPAYSRQKRLLGFRCGADGTLAHTWAWEADPHTDTEFLAGFVGAGEEFAGVDRKVIVIRDAATGEVRSTVAYPSNYASGPVTAPDGTRLAVTGYGKLYLWNTTRWGKPVRVASRGEPGIPPAFHPTRPILADPDGQTRVRFLDADTGKPLAQFQWKIGTVRCVAFSPDGTLAAAGGTSGKIVVWDVD